MITQERLKELLNYNQETGLFVWTHGRRKCRAGSVAGYAHGKKYLRITIDRKSYYAHRLAFLFVDGVMPEKQVDHIDRNNKNNRWANLRRATPTENQQNTTMQKNNKSGYTGVGWDKSASKWYARIGIGGESRHLGLYVCVHEAGAAARAARDAAGFSATHGERN